MLYGTITEFALDLTGQQKQLCAWVAEQASAGVRRIYYADARTALDIADDLQITRILGQLRERLDDVHKMIEFPIVHTSAPYFDVHRNADYIWDDYCHAEREHRRLECESYAGEIRDIESLQRDRAVCCV